MTLNQAVYKTCHDIPDDIKTLRRSLHVIRTHWKEDEMVFVLWKRDPFTNLTYEEFCTSFLLRRQGRRYKHTAADKDEESCSLG